MKNFQLPLLFSLALACYAQSLVGQGIMKDPGSSGDSSFLKLSPLKKDADPHAKASRFEGGFSYLSNEVYLGRKDSAALPYFIPQLSYYHKSGLFITASLNYLKNATDSRVDLVTVQGGYALTKGIYEGQLSVSGYFYNSQSTSVRSTLNSEIALENNLDLGVIQTTVTGSMNMGASTDFVLFFGLAHDFSLAHDRLDISPAFGLNAGTQNNYSDYYKTRRFNPRKGFMPPAGVKSITGKVLDATAFQIMDYEFSLPISYTLGRCSFEFTGTYAVPVNPALVEIQQTGSNGTVTNTTSQEKLQNSFFWKLGISYSF